MSLPSFPANEPPLTREDVINQIISSIAMEELGLSHIINAEGEKLQYALGTIDGVSGPEQPATIEDLLELNKSIHKTLDSTMMNQFFLKEKLVNALSAVVMQGPTGPPGPQGPATIDVIEEVENLKPDEKPYVRNERDTKDVLLKFGIPRGADGKSAYEVAVENGFTETEAEWLAGLEGKSAYEIAVENGFSGTEAEWLAGLEGKSAYEIAVESGFTGTEAEWLAGLEGKSAYEIAVESGFTGTEAEWLAGLAGPAGIDGIDGKSAYEVAVENGFTGTEAEWLASLEGKSSSAIIPFLSGSADTLLSSALPSRGAVVLIGNGDKETAISPNNPISIQGISQYAFSMPTDGRILKMAAFFSLTAATGAPGVTSYMRVELFSSPVLTTTPSVQEPDNSFYPVPGALISLGPIAPYTSIGTTYHSEITLADPIPFRAGTRLMIVMSHASEPTGGATIGGVMSGGISIVNI